MAVSNRRVKVGDNRSVAASIQQSLFRATRYCAVRVCQGQVPAVLINRSINQSLSNSGNVARETTEQRDMNIQTGN